MDQIKIKKETNEKIQKELQDIIKGLELNGEEEEIKKLQYLCDDFWSDISERRYEAVEEADILNGESDNYAKSEVESLRQEIRSYDILLQNKEKLKRIGYETLEKYRMQKG